MATLRMRHFPGFSVRQQSLIERLDSGVEWCGQECRHVARATNTGTRSCRFSFTRGLAGLVVDQSDSDELCDFLTIELSEFRQFGDDRADGDWSDAFDQVQNLDFAGTEKLGTTTIDALVRWRA